MPGKTCPVPQYVARITDGMGAVMSRMLFSMLEYIGGIACLNTKTNPLYTGAVPAAGQSPGT
jgi:hypothetical protein